MEKRKISFLAVFLGVCCALGVLLFSSAPDLLKATGASSEHACAGITFGTAEYSNSGSPATSSFTTDGITVISVAASFSYCSSSSGSAGEATKTSCRIGKASTAGSITFSFSETLLTKVKVLCYAYGTDVNNKKTATCSVSTSANATPQSKTVNLTAAPDISSASTEPGLVFGNLDNGGTKSTSLTISGDSAARFNLCKIVLTISSSSAATSSSAASSQSASYSSTSSLPLNVYAIEQTGQYGDCTLFKLGNYEILFDGGNTGSGPQLISYLSTYVTDHVLDMLVLTHPHTDHYGGFFDCTNSYNNGGALSEAGITSVTKFVDSGADQYSTTFQSQWANTFRAYWVNKGATYYAIENIVSGHMFDAIWTLADNFRIQWLDTSNYATPGGAAASDANYNSVSCDVRFGTYDFILCGDLPSTPEEQLATNYASNKFVATGNTVVFKACHHCSKTANSATFLAFLKPTYAWASAGFESGNTTTAGIQSQQHPYKDPRTRIETYTTVARMWWNGTSGTLIMSIPADSSSFSIHGVGRQYGDYYVSGVLVPRDSEKDTPLESTKWAASEPST